MLTRKQYALLMFIHECLKETGVSPSFDEMRNAMNLQSKSGIHRLIKALQERGFIRQLPYKARALEILKLPESDLLNLSQSTSRNMNISPSFLMNEKKNSSHDHTLSIGVRGRIAAGTPMLAIQQETHRIHVPLELIGRGEHYALEVQGDSMIAAGIFDGDTVIIQSCDRCDNGSIVVALVDEEEVTLKRLRHKGKMVALEAANPAYEVRLLQSSRVRIQGKLTGLIRKY